MRQGAAGPDGRQAASRGQTFPHQRRLQLCQLRQVHEHLQRAEEPQGQVPRPAAAGSRPRRLLLPGHGPHCNQGRGDARDGAAQYNGSNAQHRDVVFTV